jgi:hypothetical protein
MHFLSFHVLVNMPIQSIKQIRICLSEQSWKLELTAQERETRQESRRQKQHFVAVCCLSKEPWTRLMHSLTQPCIKTEPKFEYKEVLGLQIKILNKWNKLYRLNQYFL